MNCQERQDDILLYAAGDLDGAEREALRAHLASGCLRCAGSLAEAEAVVAMLAESLDPVRPSATAQRRLLAERPARGAAILPANNARVKSYSWRGWQPTAIAACLVLAASLVISILLVNQAKTDARQQGDMVKTLQEQLTQAANREFRTGQRAGELERRAGELERVNASLKSALHEAMTSNDQLVQLLHKKEASIVTLAGNEQPQATGVMIMDRSMGQAQFIAANLRAPADGRTYELWMVPKNGKPIPAGVFAPQVNGAACVRVDMPQDMGPLAALAVTDEPAGGMAAPTAKGFVVSGPVVEQ